MGAEGIIIGIAILLIIVAFYGTQISDLVNNLNSTYLNGVVNSATKPIAKAGQPICTLKVSFHATLIGAFLQINQFVTIPNGAYSIAWIGCSSNVVTNSLIPLLNVQLFNGRTLDFLTGNLGTGGTYNFNGLLTADDGTVLHPVINPVQQKFKDTLTIDNQNFDLSFTFLKVPRQHYTLQISSPEVGIGSGDQGSIYTQQVNP